MTQNSKSRREFVRDAGAMAVGAAALSAVPAVATAASPVRMPHHPGHFHQSVSRWCFSKFTLPDLCKQAGRIGISAIDLLQKEDWDVVNENGLMCSMGYAADRRDFLTNGFTNRASHAMLIKELTAALPIAKAKGVPNLIAMFGNRQGRSDADAIAAAIDGLKEVAPAAQANGVTICVELLNSKVDHKDYHGDHTWFGVEIMKGVGSPNVKLLYDIYHMQIMEGDVIRTIRQNKQWIGHYHTGGVPGRHELDDTQELNWHAVAQAIADTQFQGYLAHEFIPTRDPMTSLLEAYAACDIE